MVAALNNIEAVDRFQGLGMSLRVPFLEYLNRAIQAVHITAGRGPTLKYMDNTEEEAPEVQSPNDEAVHMHLGPVREHLGYILSERFINALIAHDTSSLSKVNKIKRILAPSAPRIAVNVSLEGYLANHAGQSAAGDPITANLINLPIIQPSVTRINEIKKVIGRSIARMVHALLMIRVTMCQNYDAAFTLTDATTMIIHSMREAGNAALGGLADAGLYNGIYNKNHALAQQTLAIIRGDHDNEQVPGTAKRRRSNDGKVVPIARRPAQRQGDYFIEIAEDMHGQCVFIALAWQFFLQYSNRYSKVNNSPDGRHLAIYKDKCGDLCHDKDWSVLELLLPETYKPLPVKEWGLLTPVVKARPLRFHQDRHLGTVKTIAHWIQQTFMPEKDAWLRIAEIEDLVLRINHVLTTHERGINVYLISGIHEERLAHRRNHEEKRPHWTLPRRKEDRILRRDYQVLDCVLLTIHNHVHLVRTYSINAALSLYGATYPALPPNENSAKTKLKYKYCRVCHIAFLGKHEDHNCKSAEVTQVGGALPRDLQEKRLKCKYCDSAFCVTGTMLKNTLEHFDVSNATGNQPGNVRCHHCNGKFYDTKCYQEHIRVKTCKMYVWCWKGSQCIMYKKALDGARIARKQYKGRDDITEEMMEGYLERTADEGEENSARIIDLDDDTLTDKQRQDQQDNLKWLWHKCNDIMCGNCDGSMLKYFPKLFEYEHTCVWKNKPAGIPYLDCREEECCEPAMYFEKTELIDSKQGEFAPFYDDRRVRQFGRGASKASDNGVCVDHISALETPVLVHQQRIAVYDFETMQTEWVTQKQPDGTLKQLYRPFVVNAVSMSHLYALEGETEPFTKYWCGENALTEFIEFVRTRACTKRYGPGLFYRGWSFYAHNGSRFDTCFIRKYCITNDIATTGLETGRKIRSLMISLKEKKASDLPQSVLDNHAQGVGTAVHGIGAGYIEDTNFTNVVSFLDSMDFIGTGLANFPKMFGLTCDAKGYFPHKFNVKANQSESLPCLPDIDYYGLNDMNPVYAMNVEKCHRENAHQPFDLQHEMKLYCENDVVILREGLKVFIDAFIRLAKVHPLGNLTIAGSCMAAYESVFLPKPTPTLFVEHTRPKPVIQTSKEAVHFFSGLNEMIQSNTPAAMCYFDKQFSSDWGYHIPTDKSVYNTAMYEYKIRLEDRNYIVDCYIPSTVPGQLGTVIEYNGCYWHGCPDCTHLIKPHKQGEHRRRYTHTQAKQACFTRGGYTFIPVWGCRAQRFVRYWSDRNVRDRVGPIERIDPRESMAGGRTEPFASLVELTGDGRCTLHYVDFTSLYPYVNAFREYPVGCMTTWVSRERGKYYDESTERLHIMDCGLNAIDLESSEWTGFALVKVRAPKHLLIPILPYKSVRPKKLFFGLCAACMMRAAKYDPDADLYVEGDTLEDIAARETITQSELEELNAECTHTDTERCWIETYTSVDIRLAIEYGYEFPEVYEMNVYDDKSDQLFKPYMNSAIKMKIKASKPPAGTVEEQEHVLDWYRKEMNMPDLKLSEIALNEGMRSTSKIIVNSLWGKFGQRPEYPDKRLFTSAQQYRQFRDNFPDKDMVDFRFWDEVDDVMEARFRTKSTNADKYSTFYQPQLAAFTTSYGRDMLYREGMAKLHPTQIVYCDTDSIVCIYDRDNPLHKEPFSPNVYGDGDGFILGTMKDELDGKVMKRFYSLAPKTYAYEKEISAKDKQKVDECADVDTKQRLQAMFTEEIKSKGFSLSRGSIEGNGFNVDSFKQMVMGDLKQIQTNVDCGLFRSTDLGEPRVRPETKVLKRPEFVKRRLIGLEKHTNYSIMRSVPWGYVEPRS